MNWIVLSALVPFFLGFVNIVDDYLSRNPFKNRAFLYVFSGGMFMLVPAILIYSFHPETREVPFYYAALMIGTGAALLTTIISFYILAIQRSGASIVVPVFQTVPALVFLGGYIVLGETISFVKLIACFVVMAAAMAITWDFQEKRFNAVSFLMALGASIAVAVYSLSMRYFTTLYDPYAIMSHVWIGFGGVSLCLIFAVKVSRQGLRQVIAKSPMVVCVGLVLQAVLQTVGELLLVHALRIAPATGLVQTLSGMQPAYVLGFFAVLGFVAPRHYNKLKMDRVLAWKIGCIIILFAGVAVISLSGHE